jgi:putative ABC transport system permease protein
MYVDLFRLALNNLFRARLRLLITTSGVFIGTSAVILLLGLTIGLQDSAESGLGDNEALTEITVYPNYQTVDFGEEVPQVTLKTLDQIQALPNVEAVSAVFPLQTQADFFVGRYLSHARVFGVAPEQVAYLPLEAQSGDISLFETGEYVLGEDALNSFTDPRSRESWLSVDVDIFSEDTVLVVGNSNGEEQRLILTPRAIFRSDNFTYNAAIFLPLDEVIRLNAWINGEEASAEAVIFQEALVRASGREFTLSLVEQIEALGYATDSLGDFLSEINNFFNLMRAILGSIGLIALIIAAFGVANTMMMAILERTSEIGLMKAVGARDQDVLSLFLIEAGLVGFVGGLIGAGISLLLRDYINDWIATEAQNSQLSILIDSAELQGELVIIPNELLIFALILATCIGLAAGAFPAWRAAKMSPVMALKEE